MFVFRKIWRAFFLETPVLRSPFYLITDDFTPVYKEKDPELIFPVFLKFSKEFIKSKSCIMLMTLSHFLCRYWKGFSSQYSLLSFIEQFKMALNKKEYARAFLMDVSRAFGTKNHQLLMNYMHMVSPEMPEKHCLVISLIIGKVWQLISLSVRGRSYLVR